MSGDILAVVGGKGGIGKTTSTINTGIALQNQGHDTVLVDADLGMTNLGAAMDVDSDPPLHDVLAGNAAVSDAIVEGPEGVSVLPGAGTLEAFAAAPPENLGPVVKSLARAYDCVLVDTGAGISQETIVPVRAADGVLLVTTPTDVAVTDTAKMGELVDRVDSDVVGTVVTRVSDDVAVDEVAEQLGHEVLAVVPEASAVDDTAPLVLAATESYSAQAYRRLAAKLGDRLGLTARQATPQ